MVFFKNLFDKSDSINLLVLGVFTCTITHLFLEFHARPPFYQMPDKMKTYENVLNKSKYQNLAIYFKKCLLAAKMS